MAVKCILTGQTPSVLDGVTENVQTQIDAKAADNAVVHLAGNETISGTKTFTGKVVMNSNDNIGIGTTTPSEKLEVNGNVKATKFKGDGSQLTNIPYPVTKVAGKTGAVTLAKGDVGLGNVDNTSDANKPISNATQAALNGKQDVLTGTQGQVVGFDENGNAVAQNAPSGGGMTEEAADGKYLKLAGGDMSGKLTAPKIETGSGDTNYFQCRKFRGEGDAATYYHAIDFGYQNHDCVDFHEYGGIWNFFKNTSGKAGEGSLCGKITTNGWEGNAKLTGSPTAPTPGTSDNSTRIATTAFVNSFNSTKLESNGDGSNVTAAFTAASTRANIATGEKLSVLFGKIAKWFADLGSLAFKSTVAKSDLASDVQKSLGKADSALQSAPVTSVNSKTGAVSLAKGDVGLGNVDNTSDANKPISNATRAALNDKQSKITANGILKGDGTGNITAADETEVELVDLPQEVFWATYGETTYAEVKAAVDSGKDVKLKFNNNGLIYDYSGTAGGGQYYLFSVIYPYAGNADIRGAQISNQGWGTLNTGSILDTRESIYLSASSWAGSDPYTQTVTLDGLTKNTKVDIQPSEKIYDQLVTDNVGYLAIKNVNGTLTVVAKGGKPSVDLNIQVTYNNVY